MMQVCVWTVVSILGTRGDYCVKLTDDSTYKEGMATLSRSRILPAFRWGIEWGDGGVEEGGGEYALNCVIFRLCPNR